MKLNWGTGIAITMGLFMAGILTLVVMSVSQDFHLVQEDYYAAEINYQQRIDATARAKKAPVKLRFNAKEGNIEVYYPKLAEAKDFKGELHFFKPDDAKKDFKIAISPDGGLQQRIAAAKIPSGFWRVKVRWEANTLSYYDEQTLVLP